MLTEQEAKKIISNILSYSGADETSVMITGGRSGNIRYARNTVSTSGEYENLNCSVTCVFGKRSGTSSCNEFNETALRNMVKTAEENARFSPENPEYMPMPGPQQYQKSNSWSEQTAAISPAFRAEAALKSIQACTSKNLVGAGFLDDRNNMIAIGNSKGLFGYSKQSNIDFLISIRTKDDKGSGFALQTVTDAKKLDIRIPTEVAAQKAIASASAIELPPGKYTVILEPAAVGYESFLGFFMDALDARSADEGRSFFGKKGEGNKLGEKLFDERITIFSDPFHPEVSALPFTTDGRPQEKVVWIENGVLKNLVYGPYWAQKRGVRSVPPPANIIFEGGSQSLADMIKASDKTILVTRTHYMRMVNPQNILVTGLTRDGVFYIENGRISHAVKNFRFNESPINMFRNLEAISKPVRINNNLVPALKVRDFNFTSLSEAV